MTLSGNVTGISIKIDAEDNFFRVSVMHYGPELKKTQIDILSITFPKVREWVSERANK